MEREKKNEPLIRGMSAARHLALCWERGWEKPLVSGSGMQLRGRAKHSQSWVVCSVRLRRVQVYNGEEENKIETENGRAVVKSRSPHDMARHHNVSWQDMVICHDSHAPSWIKHKQGGKVIRLRNSYVFKVLVMEHLEVNVWFGVVLFQWLTKSHKLL